MDKRCIAFQMKDPIEAFKHMMRPERIREYGGEAYGHRLHTWDDGERVLCRCKNCGGLFLLQSSEFHGMEDDDYYSDWFPVDSAEDADRLNREFDGFEIEEKFTERFLMETNMRFSWSKPLNEEACFDPDDNVPPVVYGPPPFMRDRMQQTEVNTELFNNMAELPHKIVGWRDAATGVYSYRFFEAGSPFDKICTISGMVIPSPPIKITGNGINWISRFDNEQTILPGTFRSVQDADTGADVWKLIYMDQGKYRIEHLMDHAAADVIYDNTGRSYRIVRNDQIIGTLCQIDDKESRRDRFSEMITKDASFDMEPFWEISLATDLEYDWMIILLALPQLRFGF